MMVLFKTMSCFQTGCCAPGYSRNDRSAGVLRSLLPMAGNSSRPGCGGALMQALLHRWTRRWAAAMALIFCVAVSPAAGYVLKGPHILELMVQHLSGFQSLQVEQEVLVNDQDLSSEPVELEETLRFILPGQFRSDIRHKGTHRIHVHAHGSNLTVVDDVIADERGSRFDRYKDLFLYASRHALHKALLIHGVDVGVTSLGKMEDNIVYVIGAAYPDDSVSQLWVDKERLLPLRWINVFPAAQGTAEPERLEFVYRNWQKVDGVWYPMEIEMLHQRKPVRRMRATKVQANAVIAGELLNIAHLKTVYKEKVAAPQEAETTDANADSDSGVDEVQRSLEEFRKKFEP